MTYASPIATIRDHIDTLAVTAGDPVRAYGGVPKTRPARFVRLMLAGATVRSVAHRDARVVIECWEASEHAAERLADLIQGWLCDLNSPGGMVPQGPDGWLGGPYSQPDPDSGTPRYVMTVNLRQGIQPEL